MNPPLLLPKPLAGVYLGVLVGVLALVLGAGSACQPNDAGASTLRVEQKPLIDVVLLSGELRAGAAVELLAPMVGMWPIPIESIMDNGSHVRAGNTVAEFDSSNLIGGLETERDQARQAETNLLATKAKMAAEEADVRFDVGSKKSALEKAKLEASIPPGIKSERDYQDLQLDLRRKELEYTTAQTKLSNQLEKAKAEIGIAQVEVAKARTEVDRIEQSLEVVALKAPRDGVLEIAYNQQQGRPYRAGDNAQPGSPVALFPDYATLRVEAFLFDVDQGLVQEGAPASVFLDAYPERRFSAHLADIQEVAQQPSNRSSRRVFRVVVELEQPDAELMRIGMSARIEVESKIEQWRDQPTLVVSRTALEFLPNQSKDADLGPTTVKARLRSANDWVPVEVGRCSLSECVVQGPEAGLVVEALPL